MLMVQEKRERRGTASGGRCGESTDCSLERALQNVVYNPWLPWELGGWGSALNLATCWQLPQLQFLCLCLSRRTSVRAHLEWVGKEPRTVRGTQEALRW